jgi:glycine/sarcosine/betaine reductase complex component A
MDLDDQSLILRAAEEHGRDDLIVVLGQPDPDSAEMAAETVNKGDPTYAGPLAGVSLGLPVYHILEDVVRTQVDAALYEAEIGLMEMAVDKDRISEGLDRVRNSP